MSCLRISLEPPELPAPSLIHASRLQVGQSCAIVIRACTAEIAETNCQSTADSGSKALASLLVDCHHASANGSPC